MEGIEFAQRQEGQAEPVGAPEAESAEAVMTLRERERAASLAVAAEFGALADGIQEELRQNPTFSGASARGL